MAGAAVAAATMRTVAMEQRIVSREYGIAVV